MSKAYRIVFACPKDGHNINLQRKCSKPALSEIDAMKIFGDEEVSCENPRCGWHGKASKTRLLRILPFDWIFSPAISR
jgi:hypothetical protein